MKLFTLILLCCFLFACDSHEVKQIKVDVPADVQVPDGMVYIPAGDFIMVIKKNLEHGWVLPWLPTPTLLTVMK